jgi:hypothetical protein
MRQVKRNNPTAYCFIQYDKLFVDNRSVFCPRYK